MQPLEEEVDDRVVEDHGGEADDRQPRRALTTPATRGTCVNIAGEERPDDESPLAENLNDKLENVHKMCTEAESNVKFAEIVSQDSLQTLASKPDESEGGESRPTDYESAALTS